MGFKIDYTPVAAVGELAVRAGRAEAAIRNEQNNQAMARQQAQIASQYELAQLQNSTRMAEAKFRAETDRLGAEQSFQYQLQLQDQKAQIAMGQALEKYDQDMRKYNMAIDEVNAADYLNDKEKEQLRMRVASKFGAGLDPKSGSSSTMQNYYDKTAAKMRIIDQVTNDPSMNEQQREAYLRAAGITPGDLAKSARTVDTEKITGLTRDLKNASAYMDRKFKWSTKGRNHWEVRTPAGKFVRKATEADLKEKTQLEATMILIGDEIGRLQSESVQMTAIEAQAPANEAMAAIEKIAAGNPAIMNAWQTAALQGVTPQQFLERIKSRESRQFSNEEILSLGAR